MAFRKFSGAQKEWRVLEFTRALDASDDWQEKKEVEKNHCYSRDVQFISEFTSSHVKQSDFTIRIRGPLHSIFKCLFISLGVFSYKTAGGY